MIKKIVFGFALTLGIILIVWWDLLVYGIGQAKGQFKVLWYAQPIEDVLSNPDFPDSLKSKIKIIDEVRNFAMKEIGLTNSDNYTTIYDQKGNNILWNLSACEPYELVPKKWSFPLLGSFPYKGFFDLEKAKQEANELNNQNFDTRIRTVGGWSTLGWFSDPILSNMLNRSEGQLADLIIHELTHSTVFIKDDITFNENLASFVGGHGAKQFLEEKYGNDSEEVKAYLEDEQDRNKFISYMLLSTSKLDSLYDSFSSVTIEEKKTGKKLFIDSIVSNLDTVAFQKHFYYTIFSNRKPNNAYFMSFVRYHSSEDSLQVILYKDYQGNLTNFIKGMKEYHAD